MGSFKDELVKHMRAATKDLLDHRTLRFDTEYIGCISVPEHDGIKIEGKAYKVTDTMTGGTDPDERKTA